MSLNPKQKKYLRKLGHGLRPVIMIAEQGLKDSLIDATREALVAHELIKIRVRVDDRDERARLIESLREATNAETVSRIGGTALLFKRNRDRPRIDFQNA